MNFRWLLVPFQIRSKKHPRSATERIRKEIISRFEVPLNYYVNAIMLIIINIANVAGGRSNNNDIYMCNIYPVYMSNLYALYVRKPCIH